MLRPPARLLAAVLLTVPVALVGASGGADALTTGPSVRSATPCKAQSVEVSTREADAVFTGTVSAVSEAPLADDPTVAVFTQTVDVERVYLGRVESSTVTVQTERIRKQCSQGRLGIGGDYVFFATGDGEPWIAAGGGGTTLASTTLLGEVEGLLGSGRAPVAPEREAAEFTEVDVAKPIRLSRAAAPGAALVIVGLLGLLVAGRLSRRAA